MKLRRVNSWFAEAADVADERYDPGEPSIVQKEYLHDIQRIGHIARMSIPPITRLDDRLHVPVYFFVLPLFAFSNASVVLVGMDFMEVLTSPVMIGVFFGLLVGKPAGIFLATWATVKLRLSDLPEGVNWGHIAGVSVLGGVGFTMAIFVTNLSFVDPPPSPSRRRPSWRLRSSRAWSGSSFCARKRSAPCAATRGRKHSAADAAAFSNSR